MYFWGTLFRKSRLEGGMAVWAIQVLGKNLKRILMEHVFT